jgi:hypothetical protein
VALAPERLATNSPLPSLLAKLSSAGDGRGEVRITKLVVVRLRALQNWSSGPRWVACTLRQATGKAMGKVMVPSPEPQLAAKPRWMIQPLGSCW